MAAVSMDRLFGKDTPVNVQISFAYGKANFPNKGMTLAAFVVEPPFARSLASKKLPRVGQQYRSMVGGLDRDGAIYAGSYNAPEGTIILMQSRHTANANSIADGAIFLRVRAGGPLVQIIASLPAHANNRLGTALSVFEGRADVLLTAEVAALGIEFPRNFVKGFMNKEEVDECFEIVPIAAGTSPAPKFEILVNEAGEAVAIAVANTPRRMRIRR